jgi:hypothetical protein
LVVTTFETLENQYGAPHPRCPGILTPAHFTGYFSLNYIIIVALNHANPVVSDISPISIFFSHQFGHCQDPVQK